MFDKRIWFLFSLILVIGLVFSGRLFFLQVVKGGFYRALVQGQSESLREVWGSRGKILFSNKQKLATNKKTTFVYLVPKKILGDPKLSEALTEILQISLDELKKNPSLTKRLLINKPRLFNL